VVVYQKNVNLANLPVYVLVAVVKRKKKMLLPSADNLITAIITIRLEKSVHILIWKKTIRAKRKFIMTKDLSKYVLNLYRAFSYYVHSQRIGRS